MPEIPTVELEKGTLAVPVVIRDQPIAITNLKVEVTNIPLPVRLEPPFQTLQPAPYDGPIGLACSGSVIPPPGVVTRTPIYLAPRNGYAEVRVVVLNNDAAGGHPPQKFALTVGPHYFYSSGNWDNLDNPDVSQLMPAPPMGSAILLMQNEEIWLSTAVPTGKVRWHIQVLEYGRDRQPPRSPDKWGTPVV